MTEEEILLQIRLRRKALKLSQSAIAEKLHISIKAYQNVEQGYTKIDLVRLRELAEVLQIDLHSLIFPNHANNQVSSIDYYKQKEDYLRIIKDKEGYISILEEKLSYYRSVLKESNCI